MDIHALLVRFLRAAPYLISTAKLRFLPAAFLTSRPTWMRTRARRTRTRMRGAPRVENHALARNDGSRSRAESDAGSVSWTRALLVWIFRICTPTGANNCAAVRGYRPAITSSVALYRERGNEWEAVAEIVPGERTASSRINRRSAVRNRHRVSHVRFSPACIDLAVGFGTSRIMAIGFGITRADRSRWDTKDCRARSRS